MTRLLVSIDVGGTLGQVDGPSLTATLAEASPLNPADARRVIRQGLHTQPTIDGAVIADLCQELRIPVSAFPSVVEPAPLRLVPEALPAVRLMSQYATVVTLSNVTCLEAETEHLRTLFHPWVVDHFPSCRTGYAKPDPAAFRHVVRRYGARENDMVHIGDDWTCDVLGPRSAGATAIWISKGRVAPEPDRLSDQRVLVAADLAAASHQLANLAQRRRS